VSDLMMQCFPKAGASSWVVEDSSSLTAGMRKMFENKNRIKAELPFSQGVKDALSADEAVALVTNGDKMQFSVEISHLICILDKTNGYLIPGLKTADGELFFWNPLSKSGMMIDAAGSNMYINRVPEAFQGLSMKTKFYLVEFNPQVYVLKEEILSTTL